MLVLVLGYALVEGTFLKVSKDKVKFSLKAKAKHCWIIMKLFTNSAVFSINSPTISSRFSIGDHSITQ